MRITLVLVPLIAACATEPARTAAPTPSEARAVFPEILACADMVCPPEAHCEVESRYFLDPGQPEGQHLEVIQEATCVMDEVDIEPVG